MATRSLASKFDKGSSIKNTFASRTIARPIAIRWRWPPERSAGLRSKNSFKPRISAASHLYTFVDIFPCCIYAISNQMPCCRTQSCGVKSVVFGIPWQYHGVFRCYVVYNSTIDRTFTFCDVFEDQRDHTKSSWFTTSLKDLRKR